MSTTLLATLQDYDLDLLNLIAARWDVELDAHDARVAAERLSALMLEPERAAHEWSRLNDRERGTLQFLLSAPNHQMPLAKYSRLYGDIRAMGPEMRAREKPHLTPLGAAEVLYYRGLVATSYGQGTAGMQPIVFVPSDLAAVLPVHVTGYDLTQEDEGDFEEDESEDAQTSNETQLTQSATTSLVDDLATLLAYLQIEHIPNHGDLLPGLMAQSLDGYLLGGVGVPRVALMLALLETLGLVGNSEDGSTFKPIPTQARKWLDQARTDQVKSLVTAWHNTPLFNELAHVSGLVLETERWPNDPTLLRLTLQTALASFDDEEWVAAAEVIETIKQEEPDFQRPAANYESWYIRDASSDDYLHGFENWDYIEGATLAFTLTAVLPWLGLADLGESEVGVMLRLTAYGKAYLGLADWPRRPDSAVQVKVDENGQVLASRNLSRYDRFQLARFTDWGTVGEPYQYYLSTASLTRARQGGIKAEHILTFLRRTAEQPIPQAWVSRLETWGKSDGAALIISQLIVLQTEREEELQTLWETPQIRRYLGARLGGRAVTVRADQWEALAAALGELGLQVEVKV